MPGHDSLATSWGTENTHVVLANPPFGKKQSLLFVNEEGDTEKEDQVVVREDFWTSTSNKQLNFVQHIYSLLKIDGRAAVVVPDNVLFEGGAGEKVRRNLLQEVPWCTRCCGCPPASGTPGVKANVIFFDKKEGRAEGVDGQALGLRPANEHAFHVEAERRSSASDFDEFVECYKPGKPAQAKAHMERRKPEGRWRCYDYEESAQARQAQPRPLLDQGQEPDRY